MNDPEKHTVVRVGLAGAGWVSGYHLDAWQTLTDRAAVVAIADPLREAAETKASKYGIPAVHESVEEMLEGSELDAIDVAAPIELHASVCRMAADRGLAILCQKPLTPDLTESEELAAYVNDRARMMVHENWRFRPHYRRMREWIEGGRVGEVRTVIMSVLTSGLLPDENGDLHTLVRRPVTAVEERFLLLDTLVHHVDVLRFLVGPLILRAARIGKACQEILGEDRVTLFLDGARGEAVSVISDYMAHGHPAEQMDRLEILGSEGSIFLDRGHLRLVSGAGEEAIDVDLQADYKASYRGAILHFLDRLADGSPFETSPEDNLETLRIVDEGYRIGGYPGL